MASVVSISYLLPGIVGTYQPATYTYYLKVDNIDHMFTRFATQSPLPATGANVPGNNFWLDLGMIIEQITLTGLVDTKETWLGAPYSANTVYPSKIDLEFAVRSWWIYTSAQGTNINWSLFPQLTIANEGSYNNQVYAVEVKQADFKKAAAEEDRWSYTLVLLVGSKISG